MTNINSRYERKNLEIYVIDDRLLKELIKDKIPNPKELEEILNDEEIKKITLDSLEEYIAAHISNIRIRSSLPPEFRPYISRFRKIGFDHPGLMPSRILTPKTPVYVSQQFLNNIAGITNGRVLGAYDPNTDTMYILDSLVGEDHNEVFYHENLHREHLEWPESQVRRATASAGYNKFQGVYN